MYDAGQVALEMARIKNLNFQGLPLPMALKMPGRNKVSIFRAHPYQWP